MFIFQLLDTFNLNVDSYLISHCCCTPITEPGRHIRVHAIASTAVNDQCFTIYEATKQPVLPKPAKDYR